MKTLYESTFTATGPLATEALEDNFLITFGEGAPKDVAEYCFIHRAEINEAEHLCTGAIMTIGEGQYPVTAVGDVASENLRELGHITVRFDGACVAEFPGTVHVAGKPPATVKPGQKFRLVAE